MTRTTFRRDGGYRVELTMAIDDGRVRAIDIEPVSADQILRWNADKIDSTFMLLGELTGLDEDVIRQLKGTDFDRVMIAFGLLMPSVIRDDFQEGRKPLSQKYDLGAAVAAQRLAAAVAATPPAKEQEQPAVEPAAPVPEPAKAPVPEPARPPTRPPTRPPDAPRVGPRPRGKPVATDVRLEPTPRTHPLPPNPVDPRYPLVPPGRTPIVDDGGGVDLSALAGMTDRPA